MKGCSKERSVYDSITGFLRGGSLFNLSSGYGAAAAAVIRLCNTDKYCRIFAFTPHNLTFPQLTLERFSFTNPLEKEAPVFKKLALAPHYFRIHFLHGSFAE